MSKRFVLRRAAFACVALAATCSAGVAFGQAAAPPSPADKAAADVLYQTGKKLMKEGKFADACPKFAESQRLDPGIGTMLWLADCYEKNGQTASAWAEFREAQAEAAKQHDSREKVAGDRAAALAGKLPTLVIGVAEATEVPGLEIKRDGSLVGKPLWGAKVPIDPGTHIIVATAPGKKTWETAVEIPSKPGPTEIAILPLEDAPAGSGPTKPQGPSPAPDTSTPYWGTQRVAAVAVAGVAAVALGVGVFYGIRTKSRLDDSNADGHCREGNRCDALGVEARQDAQDAGTMSTVFFIVGGVALGGAAALWFTAPRPGKSAGSYLAPSFDGQRVMLRAGASW